MTIYEDVKDLSTSDYFYGNKFAIDAFNKKYTEIEGESYVDAVWRVCRYVASVEKTELLRDYWARRWFDEIFNDWWHPAGSIMQGAGSSRKISLANCTTISLGSTRPWEEWDSLESIIKNTAYTVAKTAAYRQGLGVAFDRIRPMRMRVENSSKESQGVPHWMKYIDQIGYFIGQKGRIPAMLFSLVCTHPDIIEFINLKKDYTVIQNANISVQCHNSLYEAAIKDEDWELFFEIPEINVGDKVYVHKNSTTESCEQDENGFYYVATRSRKSERISKKVSAREILELIAKGMVNWAEPGIQNIDIARKYSNSDYLYDPNHPYDSRISSTNACQPSWAPVLTRGGISTIGSIIEGGEIWSENGWVKVVEKWSTGIKRVYRYRTTAGVFYGTENHRIVSGGSRVKVENADSIDVISGPYNSNIVIDPQDVMDGIVFGDGSIHKASNDLVHLYIGDDDQDYFNSEIAHLITKHRPGIKDKAYEIKTTVVANELDYTYNRSIPKRFIEADPSRVAGFIRGLFTANGGMCGDRVALKTSSWKVCEQVQLMLSSLGIRSYYTTNKPTKVKWTNGEYTSKESYDVNVTVDKDKFLAIIGFVQNYKTEQLSKIVASRTGRGNRKLTYDIISIDLISEEEVFDITVDGESHTYWSGNCNISNCSEQYLSPDSLCVLASINAGKFSIVEDGYEKELSIIGESINRFLDNVNECELAYHTYATPNQKLAIESLRRTGAGYTNLAGWLFKKNLEYGSPAGNDAVDKFTERYNYHLYLGSRNLGREKGSFGLFNRSKFEQSPFIRHMMDLGIEFDAMRNVTCSSIAPTGTLSLMFRDLVFSYGIEPAFGIYFWKRTRISGKYEYYFCVPSIVKEVFRAHNIEIPMESDSLKDAWDGRYGIPIARFIDEKAKELNINFKKAMDVDPIAKLDLMSKVMKNIDSSISVTYMLPEGSDWKDVYQFILEAYKREVKSVAAFPDKKMYGIVSFIPFKELALKLIAEGVDIHDQNFSEVELAELNNKNGYVEGKIVKTDAPKRPKTLLANIHKVSVKGKPHHIIVGMLHDDPYEVMICGELPQHNEKGSIVKIRKGCYQLLGQDNNILCANIIDSCTCEEANLSRFISMSLRHGVNIDFIVEQLRKSTGDVTSMSKALARILSKYEKASVKAGDCPNCGGQTIRSEGCISCSCGWSKC